MPMTLNGTAQLDAVRRERNAPRVAKQRREVEAFLAQVAAGRVLDFSIVAVFSDETSGDSVYRCHFSAGEALKLIGGLHVEATVVTAELLEGGRDDETE